MPVIKNKPHVQSQSQHGWELYKDINTRGHHSLEAIPVTTFDRHHSNHLQVQPGSDLWLWLQNKQTQDWSMPSLLRAEWHWPPSAALLFRLLSYLILLVLIRPHLALNPDLNLIQNRWVGSRTDSIKQSSVSNSEGCGLTSDIPGELILSTRARVSSAVKEHLHPGCLSGRVPIVCLKITRSVSKRHATTTDWNHARVALSWSPCYKWRVYWALSCPNAISGMKGSPSAVTSSFRHYPKASLSFLWSPHAWP